MDLSGGEQPAEKNSVEKGIFRSRDHTPLYYEVRGKGKPLILCYGLTCRIEHWRHQLNYFSRTHRVISLDYRGHHRSGTPRNSRHMTLKWCARDVEDLCDYLGLKEAIVMGHSFGAPICVHLANFRPELVKGVVLICGSVVKPFQHMFHSDKLDSVFRMSSSLYQWAPALMTRTWHEVTKQNWFSYFLTARFGFNAERSSRKDIVGYLRGVHDSPIATFHNLLKDYNDFDGRELLPTVTCPALVIAGTEDWITPLYLQEEMANLLPKAELVKIPKGSHNAHMDFPERVNKLIEKFLKAREF